MKLILLFFLFFPLSLFSAEITGKVIKISDGDTITILDSNNRKYKIRLDKIDAPDLQMVQDGFAWHYSFYDKSPEYIEAEQKARQNKSGLWIQENPKNPYEFRKKTKKINAELKA